MDGRENVLMQRYELGRLLGQGNFAKVYYGRNLKVGGSVAIKLIDKNKIMRTGLMEQIRREISVMRLVKHPNIVQLHEVMATKTKIYFIMEYVKGGELFDRIARGRLREERARKLFQQLISAVNFCHNQGVYHRDLKPENILLDGNGNLKVSDFGLSALVDSKRQDGLLHTTCGTPAYVSPEVISKQGYDGAKADIWSCGVVLFVLVAGYLPFQDSNLMEMYRKIGKAQYKCPNWFTLELRKLLQRILDPNCVTRISMPEIMESPWFKNQNLGEKNGGYSDSNDMICIHLNSISSKGKSNQDSANHSNMNAFDIISLASGFNLSGLFSKIKEKTHHNVVKRFTCWQKTSDIVTKLEEIANKLEFKVSKDNGGLKIEDFKNESIEIDVEIFQITSSIHIVELKMMKGDISEYQKLWDQDIKPALDEIVWSWHDEKSRPSQLLNC